MISCGIVSDSKITLISRKLNDRTNRNPHSWLVRLDVYHSPTKIFIYSAQDWILLPSRIRNSNGRILFCGVVVGKFYRPTSSELTNFLQSIWTRLISFQNIEDSPSELTTSYSLKKGLLVFTIYNRTMILR